MGVVLVGEHLAWRHGTEHKLLSFHLEVIVIGTPIVNDTSVKLPWPSKEEVANGHREDITFQCVFIGADLERDLYSMLNLYGAGVAKPLNLVGVRVLRLG